LIAGYYDSGNGGASASNILSQLTGVPGVQGLMYTTWVDDYSQIAQFASAARANWGSYVASLPTSSPTVTNFKVLYGSKFYTTLGSTRTRLPWQITGIQVTFSEPITKGNAASLSGLAATGFSGLGTNTLTWTFPAISQGAFTAFLQGGGSNALLDAAGHGLSNGQGFTQALKILWGDFNGDGVVDSKDVAGVSAVASTTTYNYYADVNGDGVVNAADVAIVQSRLGTSQQ
jgi:hypothetical protein